MIINYVLESLIPTRKEISLPVIIRLDLGLSSSLNGDPNQILLPVNLWRILNPKSGAYHW